MTEVGPQDASVRAVTHQEATREYPSFDLLGGDLVAPGMGEATWMQDGNAIKRPSVHSEVTTTIEYAHDTLSRNSMKIPHMRRGLQCPMSRE